MAEGWINHLLGDAWEARSAGTAPASQDKPIGRITQGRKDTSSVQVLLPPAPPRRMPSVVQARAGGAGTMITLTDGGGNVQAMMRGRPMGRRPLCYNERGVGQAFAV